MAEERPAKNDAARDARIADETKPFTIGCVVGIGTRSLERDDRGRSPELIHDRADEAAESLSFSVSRSSRDITRHHDGELPRLIIEKHEPDLAA